MAADSEETEEAGEVVAKEFWKKDLAVSNTM
jgi:hypothetical protein